MEVVHSEFSIAEYCDQMKQRKIIVNHEYQRSPGIWPPAARSYLIDTIILGFPVPKLSLYEHTDIKSRTTIKEIVDGQQRSETILSFYLDKFRISGKSAFSGKTFSDLDEEDQTRFLTYRLCADTFVGASVHEIREVFRRINSYTVPLNSQEQRHARFQGAFKWFMVDLTERYSQVLKDIGVFTERQLLRMADAELLTEVIMAVEMGILSASKRKIDKFYEEREKVFPTQDQINARMDAAFARILRWVPVHKTALMKSYSFYSLLLAVMHAIDPVPALMSNYEIGRPLTLDDGIVQYNLGKLAAVLGEPEQAGRYAAFVKACSQATNRLEPRKTRFRFLCQAMGPEQLP